MIFQELSNDLVHLIPLSQKDFDDLFSVASDEKIWKGHPDSMRYTPDGFSVYFDKLLQTDRPYLIFSNDTGQIIGATSYYDYDATESQVAIGYTFIAVDYWGGVYNKSIKELMIKHAFLYVNKVIFHVAKSNKRSQSALSKIGAVLTGYDHPNDPEKLIFEIRKK